MQGFPCRFPVNPAEFEMFEDAGDFVEMFLVNLAYVGCEQLAVSSNNHCEWQTDKVDTG